MGHFRNLERLDLFRTNIELDVLLMVLKNNPKLKHLNLGNLILTFHREFNFIYDKFIRFEQHFVN